MVISYEIFETSFWRESSTLVNICRISDCIMALRIGVMALLFLFLSIFLSVPILHVYIEKFVSEFSQVILELES